MVVLIATPGGINSNSYVTIQEANEYFANRLHSSLWDADAPKTVALITATRVINNYVQWQGWKTSQYQAIDWPRDGVVDKDGYLVNDSIIPKAVKEATCEMAYYLIQEDRTLPDDLAGLRKVKLDVLEVTTAENRKEKDVIPGAVLAILGEFGTASQKRKNIANLIRG